MLHAYFIGKIKVCIHCYYIDYPSSSSPSKSKRRKLMDPSGIYINVHVYSLGNSLLTNFH